MIRVDREAEPRGLRENSVAWGEELCDARLSYYQELKKHSRSEIIIKPKKPDALKTKYASEEVKNALGRMFAGKCCYCESKVEAVSYLNVEHFRPQSVYPKLAYRWTNLLYACSRCNSGHKLDLFPIAPDAETPKELPDAPCHRDDSDERLLVDPCRDEPSEHFAYEFIISDTRDNLDVDLICLSRNAEITRDVCGLRREALSDERRKHFRQIWSVVDGYRKAEKLDSQDLIMLFGSQIRDFSGRQSPYSAMARAYIVEECRLNF